MLLALIPVVLALGATPLNTNAPPAVPAAAFLLERTSPTGQAAISQGLEWLGQQDSAQREKAVKLLLTLGEDVAAQTLLAALTDERAIVRDGAQSSFHLLPGEAAVPALLGRDGLQSRNRPRRLRCAEILGRVNAPVKAEALLRHVKKRDAELSRTLLWTIERLAARDLLVGKRKRTIKAVRQLTGRGDNDLVRAAALQALSILAPRDGAISVDNLEEKTGPETAAAIMDALVRLRPPTFMAGLRHGVVHPNPLVRMRAVDMLRTAGMNRIELDLLVERLDEEPRPAIRSRIRRVLMYMTGHPGSDEVNDWTAFMEGLPASWTAADTTTSISSTTLVSGSIDKLEQLAPESDRIAILVDVSSAYWSKSPSGQPISDAVAQEIERLLRRIEQSASFLFIPFAEDALPFSKAPIPATSTNLDLAREHLQTTLPAELDRAQSSNIGAALDYALQFPEIDRVIVVSPAHGHTGTHVDVPLMARLYGEKTRFRPAIFDFVAINLPEEIASPWEQLTSTRAGRLFMLKLK